MDLKQKIKDRSVIVGVIGLGYVGLPLIHAFWTKGLRVLGFDVDEKKIKQLRKGENYLKHLGKNFVSEMAVSDHFEVTDDFGRLGEPDAILICVPTPLGAHLDPDLTYVENAADAIARTLRTEQLVALESTTYPGTTEEVILPRLTGTGLKCGEDFYLAYSPEREDPGAKGYTTETIPKLVGGVDEDSGKVAAELYQLAIEHVVPVSSAKVAEAAKILENIYRSVNIAMVNEMKTLLTAMDIDVWEVIDAASTKPFGYQAFYPGPGLGGHCIPIDPFYLTWKAREVGLPTRFIELAGEINRTMPNYVIQRTVMALNLAEKAIRGARMLVLGLAYKPNVDDVRESPSFELIEKFQALGAEVDYNDPHVPTTHKMRHHDLKMSSIELTGESLGEYDCVVIATHHDAYDWQMIADNSRLIVDTRGALRKVTGRRDHIISA